MSEVRRPVFVFQHLAMMARYGVALFVALFVASCLGQACDIEGTWVASETSVGVVATFTFEFNSDGTFSLDEVEEYSNPTCDGEYTFDGRYTLSSSDSHDCHDVPPEVFR